MSNSTDKIYWSNILALVITGVCLGWLECSRDAGEVSTILGLAVTIISGTVILGATIKIKQADAGKKIITQLINADKSAWPFAIFLLAFTLGPPVIELIVGPCSK